MQVKYDAILQALREKDALDSAGVIAALGYTPEDVANKSTNVTTDGASDTKYPSAKAVKTYADALVVGLLDDRGNYNASVNTFPASGGSGTAGAILKGDLWFISVAGTLGGIAVAIGDTVRALADTPGQTAGNWVIMANDVGYLPVSRGGTGTFTHTDGGVLIGNGSGVIQATTAGTLGDALISGGVGVDPTFQNISTRTETITNKRVTRRAPTVTQSATPAINTDITDVAHIVGLAQAITSMTSSLTGTPVEGDMLRIDITDGGTARAITWGASFEASRTVALPTTTVLGVRLDAVFVWNTVTTKWRCVGVS